jgi:hypothetical protein
MSSSPTGKVDRSLSPMLETHKVPTRSTAGMASKLTAATTIAEAQRAMPARSFKGLKINFKDEASPLKHDECVHIELDIDAADSFDYEDVKNAKYAVPDLERMLNQEVDHYLRR